MSGLAAAVAHELERECTVFSTYLGVRPPTRYVVEKYVAAHQCLSGLTAADRFDAVLVAIAVRHRMLTKIADAYARLFASASALRNKLVLLLAILETSKHCAFRSGPRGRASTVFRLGIDGSFGVACAVLGILLLAPIHLVLRLDKRPT